jgi:cytochrome b6-f complex iron-sulfur subunit
MSDLNVNTPQRRKFLAVLLGLVGAGLAGISAWPVLRYLSPQTIEGDAIKVAIAKTLVKSGKVHFFNFHGQPAVVLQPSPGRIVAFSAVCTHLGCVIQWQANKGEFLCPCHAGRFGIDGKVLGGPPPKPLKEFPVTLEDDQILVG